MGFWETVGTDEWWLEHALDGIAGGGLASLAAAAAVIATIRHERGWAEETVLRTKVAEVVALALRSVHELNQKDEHGDAPLADVVWRVASALMELEAHAARRAPELRRDIDSFAHAEVGDNTPAIVADEQNRLGSLIAVMHVWLQSPKAFRKREPVVWDERFARNAHEADEIDTEPNER